MVKVNIFSDFSGNVPNISSFNMMVALGLLHHNVLTVVRKIFLYPVCLRFFIMKRCSVLPDAFASSIVIIIWLLFFSLLVGCSTFIDLHMLDNPCKVGINDTWSSCVVRFFLEDTSSHLKSSLTLK